MVDLTQNHTSQCALGPGLAADPEKNERTRAPLSTGFLQLKLRVRSWEAGSNGREVYGSSEDLLAIPYPLRRKDGNGK